MTGSKTVGSTARSVPTVEALPATSTQGASAPSQPQIIRSTGTSTSAPPRFPYPTPPTCCRSTKPSSTSGSTTIGYGATHHATAARQALPSLYTPVASASLQKPCSRDGRRLPASRAEPGRSGFERSASHLQPLPTQHSRQPADGPVEMSSTPSTPSERATPRAPSWNRRQCPVGHGSQGWQPSCT